MVSDNLITIENMVRTASFGGEILVLLIMVVYLIFAFVLIRRLKIMNQNFSTPYAGLFFTMANVHFIATLIVIILTFLSLRR